MFQKNNIIIILIAVLAIFCFVVIANAAKGGGGCKDRDGDGFYQKAGCGSAVDCDDSDAAVNPNAAEVCDGIDNNCDSIVDEGCGGCTDNDDDGYGDGPDCLGADCDDADPNTYPGAPLLCDARDNDCDGSQDFPTDEDKDNDGVPLCAGDCDDNNPNRSPDISEGPAGDPTCSDGIDNDCDNLADGADFDCACTDNDLDGYGNGPFCLGPDCDDNDPSINPGAAEVCDDNVDNNCDGTIDENCGGCVPTANKERDCDCFDNADNDCDGSIDSLDKDCRNQTCDTCIDNDGDGFGVNGDPSCTYPGIVDCDDTDPTINPLGIDLCDGIDRDCDGQTINDNDNDGFGVPASPYCTYNIEDCDDTDPTINPLGIDLCDGIDRDCDGQTINDNDNDGFGVPASPYCTYNIEDCDDTDPTINPLGIDLCDGIDRDCDGQTINDNDNDGFGVPASPYCTYNIEDCDDTDPTINPLGIDLCDGIDRDCDGQTINDNDNDGFGVPASPYCTYNIEDCDDTDPSVNPFAIEGPFADPTCSDTKDNDCDGLIDISDPDCEEACVDLDFDGYGVNSAPSCPIQGYDCDDSNFAINPGNIENDFCIFGPQCSDGLDNDCDGLIDGADASCDCDDCDGDGYGVSFLLTCPGGSAVDCDNDDRDVNPGVVEGPYGDPTCFDYKDNDCDGAPDQADDACFDSAEPPHDTQPFIDDCSLCHMAADDFVTPIPNAKCEQCHTPGGSLKISFPTAPDVQTHLSNFYNDPTTGLPVNLECIECHNPMRLQPNLMSIREYVRGIAVFYPPYVGTFPPYIGICDACHTQTAYYREDGTGQPHNEGSDCGSCHAHSEGFVTIVDCFGPHDTVTDCNVCHVSPDFTQPIPNSQCDQCHIATGSLKGNYPAAPDVETHQGNSFSFSIECVECHTDHCYDNNINLKLVRSTIAGSAVPGSQIVFTSYTGPGSFADGPPYEENICNTCHTMTGHHQADGVAPGGQDHMTGDDCTQCHSHLPNGYFPTF